MDVKNHKIYSIDYFSIVWDILDVLGENILYSYSHVSSNLYNIIEGMEFDTKYLSLKAVDELDPNDKNFYDNMTKVYSRVPKIILDWAKVVEVMDEWFDDNYNSDIYVTKDYHKIVYALASQLYVYETEILTVKFKNYVDICNKRAKCSTSQYLINDTPAKCKGCTKLYACKLVGQGFTDICRYKEQAFEGSSFCGISA